MAGKHALVFWFDQPPKVSLGVLNYVVQQWPQKVIYVVEHSVGTHRNLIGWNETTYPGVELINLYEQKDVERCIDDIFSQYRDAIHILNGMCSNMEKRIRKYIRRKDIKLMIMTERPAVYKCPILSRQKIKSLLLPVKYRLKHLQYDTYVRALLPLGQTGKRLFMKYGWCAEKVFPFMYCPVLQSVSPKESVCNTVVRFLYVGRFVRKRLNTIMYAIEHLTQTNWELNLVGGYGADAESIIAWAQEHEKVNFLGAWPADEVGQRMQNYDVYLLATQYDGWNAQVNEALNAGLGIITTDEAVSDELVSASGAGVVVASDDQNAFAKAMDDILKNPEVVSVWKNSAFKYRARIDGQSVGNYFIDIINYVFYGEGERPECPWLS